MMLSTWVLHELNAFSGFSDSKDDHRKAHPSDRMNLNA